jgi:peptide/nickel transport system permease protein
MPFIVRRLIFYVVAAWVALTVNFFIPRLMPGNAVDAIMAKFPNLQPSAYRALEALLGVGHPGSIWHQYSASWSRAVRNGPHPTITLAQLASKEPSR